MKGELKAWRLEAFGNLETSIENKTKELERLDILDDTFGLDESEAELRGFIMSEIFNESSWKEAQLFQKARIKWALEGDLNSRFFHKWINSRTKLNTIDGVKVHGSWIDSVPEVKEAIHNHFRDHFSTLSDSRLCFGDSLFSRKLEDADNSYLASEFTEIEIKDAIWSVDSNSSPVPDGFTFGFFKHNWEIIKSDILHMMREFHSNGKIVKGLNTSFITLIPKLSSPQRIEDYRPISLISGAYKIIAKVLANRLSKVTIQ